MSITAKTSESNTDLAQTIIGISPALCQIRAWITQVAQTMATVLITGESGTGKEKVAQAIHACSEHRSGPFIPVNCGAIPIDLLESELFGYEKGAFTGAMSRKLGRIELAHQGTLFLDEIGDMPLLMQVKLLRVLQERCFERIGGHHSVQASFRVIAATHRDLHALVQQGLFREDLFYRLNVFPMTLPALRERPEDLPVLIQVLLTELQTRGYKAIQLTDNLLADYRAYPWPGNIRELMNRLERLCILYPGQILDTDPWLVLANGLMTETMQPLPTAGFNLIQHLNEIEKQLIQQALKQSGGIVSKAAACLQLKRTTLIEKIKRHQLAITSPV